MYHSVGDGPDGLTVTPARLEEHLAWLEHAGFKTVSMKDTVDRRNLPAQPVVLTFDDGFDDAYSQALPALRRHGMKAMFFVVTGFVADDPSTRQADPSTGRHYLTWDEVRGLRDAGMEIGSHTVRHGLLGRATHDEIRYEVEESKRTLEKNLGQPVDFFSYPFTMQKVHIRRAVQHAGYRAAVVGPRGGLDRFELQRIVVHRWMGANELRDFLAEPWGAQ